MSCGVALLALLLAGVSTLPVCAKNFVLQDQKLTVTAPDNWKEIVPVTGATVLQLKSPDGLGIFIISATAVNSMPPSGTPNYEQQLMQQMLGGQFSSGHGHTTLAGVDFLGMDVQSLMPNHGGMIYSRLYATFVNNCFLLLDCSRCNYGLPQNNADLMGIINSLAFNGTPLLPARAAAK
jgi:hypothetical protein